MLKYVLSVLLFVSVLTVCAQKQTTVFKNLTWEQAAELAQKEGKIVLVDAMRKARTPQDQKKQDAEVKALFAKPEIAAFCKEHVVAIQIDMASEAGAAFAPKLVMNMYPTYGFFMPNGDILGVVSPYLMAKDPSVFVKNGQKAWDAAVVKKQNKRSIEFEELTLKEAMVKAKKENKLIFVDAYTDYCQPCVLMVKNVFSLDRVADFYNEHFINLKLNFSREKELAEKYGTSGYPSFLFINGNGKLVHLAGGYTEGDAFIAYGGEALKKAQGIEFFHGDWEQALAQAKQENKLIFMDCYTSWCGPCKMLAKDVFTDPEVAALFNEKFVNVKSDMEKGEGKKLKEVYKVSAYPTLNFINGDGELVHCVVGGVEATELMQQAGLALEGKGSAYMDGEYAKGNRQPEFVTDYLTMLDMANRAKDAQQVCLEYFANLDKSNLKDKAYWDLFMKYVNDVNSDVFGYVYEHRAEFYPVFGEKDVKRKISTVWAIGANQFVQGQGEKAVFDQKGFKKYVKRLSKADVDNKFDIIAAAEMANAEKIGDWKNYMVLGSKRLQAGHVSDMELYNWGLRVDRGCKDVSLRMQAAKWFDDAAASAAKKEAEGKAGMMSFRTYFEKLATALKQAPTAA